MATPEAVLKSEILADIGAVNGLRIWNHPTGSAYALKPPHPVIKFGCKGSGDLIGIRSILITPEMVGQVIGQAVSIEVKVPPNTQETDQKNFEKMWTAHGGLYVLAKSIQDCDRVKDGIAAQ